MNKISLMGRTTRDFDVRVTSSGTTVATTSLAVDRYAGKGKEKTTDFIPLVFFGKTAEFVVEKAKIGGRLLIEEGSLRVEPYEKDGQRRVSFNVVVRDVKVIDWKEDGDAPAPKNTAKKSQKPQETPEEDLSDLFGEIDLDDIMEY